jgi:IclR family acetate operon transcriptional repressor
MNERVQPEALPRPVVKSADRALDVIEFVTGAGDPPTFSRIARELGVPKSSLSQLLSNLVARRYLELDSHSSTYRPGEALIALVQRAALSIPMRALVMPVLERLRDEINETAGFYVAAGDEVELVASAPSRQALVFIMKAGDRAPLHAISAGKIRLADMTPAEREAYFDRHPLVRFTERTILDRAVLERELEKVRRSGFGTSNCEYSRGIQGIACAVRVAGGLAGAVNVSVPEMRFDARLRDMAQGALRVAAAELSRILSARHSSSALG